MEDPVIGVAFDGTGYGTDGTLWGGEFLIADLHGFERAGHLEPVPMPGGSAAIHEPWRMAAAYGAPSDLPIARRPDWSTITEMAARRVNAPLTSSMGRLFDAVAAVLGVRDRINYEGQAAIELEQRADLSEAAGYPATITGEFTIMARELLDAVVADLKTGVPVPTIAARFHNGVAALIVDAASRIRDERNLHTVALSGGVFQNMSPPGTRGIGPHRGGFRSADPPPRPTQRRRHQPRPGRRRHRSVRRPSESRLPPTRPERPGAFMRGRRDHHDTGARG